MTDYLFKFVYGNKMRSIKDLKYCNRQKKSTNTKFLL